MVATPHPCHCLSIFRGRARPMWISGTAISRLTDTDDLWLRSVCFGSGAQEKSTHGIVFLRSISACSNQPTAHAGGVHIRHSVWHTVLYGFIWCASCLHRESKWFPICCEFRRRIYYVCDYFMRTKIEVTTKLEEVISDLQSPWKAHWPYYIGFKVALEGALAVFVWIWVAINAIIVETVASLECKWKWEQSLSVNARILSSRGHLQVCRKSME